MAAPTGTFMAPVRKGVIQFPPPLKAYCEAEGWTLFLLAVESRDVLTLRPVAADTTDDVTTDRTIDEYQSSLDPEGRLWIPAELRERVMLGEQSVMVRVEGAVIKVFLRKVFETLGFRPA